MATSAQIPLSVQGPQFESPLNALAKALQVQELQRQNEMGGLQLQQTKQGMEEQNALRRLLSEQNFDITNPESQRRAMAISPTGAQGLIKSRADALKSQSELQKSGLENAAKRIDLMGQTFGYVRDNPTAQNAASAVQSLLSNGVIDQQQAISMMQSVSQNPDPANIKMLADKAFQSALSAKEQLPKMGQFDTGGAVLNVQTPVTGGAPRVVSQFGKTQSPDSKAADSRSKEYNDAIRGLKLEEMQAKRDDRVSQKNAQISSVQAQIDVIDKALNHPGRSTATGLSGSVDPRNYIPGTDAADFRAVLDQIGGTAFLQAFESLKGGGQITEVEGKKATDAIARLSRAQSDSEFVQSLKDLKAVMQAGLQRQKTKPTAASAPASNIDALLEKYK